MRSILLGIGLTFLVAGCTVNKKSQPGSHTGMISAVGGLVEATGKPSPAPNPAPSGDCDNCGGDGIVGDGTIEVKCGVCGGDGKLDKTVPKKTEGCTCKDCDCVDCKCKKPAVVYVPLVEKPAPVKAAPPVMQDCPSGMCGPQASQSTQTTVEDSYEQPRQRRGLFGRRRGR